MTTSTLQVLEERSAWVEERLREAQRRETEANVLVKDVEANWRRVEEWEKELKKREEKLEAVAEDRSMQAGERESFLNEKERDLDRLKERLKVWEQELEGRELEVKKAFSGHEEELAEKRAKWDQTHSQTQKMHEDRHAAVAEALGNLNLRETKFGEYCAQRELELQQGELKLELAWQELENRERELLELEEKLKIRDGQPAMHLARVRMKSLREERMRRGPAVGRSRKFLYMGESGGVLTPREGTTSEGEGNLLSATAPVFSSRDVFAQGVPNSHGTARWHGGRTGLVDQVDGEDTVGGGVVQHGVQEGSGFHEREVLPPTTQSHTTVRTDLSEPGLHTSRTAARAPMSFTPHETPAMAPASPLANSATSDPLGKNGGSSDVLRGMISSMHPGASGSGGGVVSSHAHQHSAGPAFHSAHAMTSMSHHRVDGTASFGAGGELNSLSRVVGAHPFGPSSGDEENHKHFELGRQKIAHQQHGLEAAKQKTYLERQKTYLERQKTALQDELMAAEQASTSSTVFGFWHQGPKPKNHEEQHRRGASQIM